MLSSASFLWLGAHRYLSLESDSFLIVRIDGKSGGRILPGLAQISLFQKDAAEQNSRIDQFLLLIPENCRLQCGDGGFLIAAPLINSATVKESLGRGGLDVK